MASTRKLSGGRCRGKPRRELPDGLNRGRILIHSKHFVTGSQEVDEIATRSTPDVEHTHPWHDASAEQLIEEVDIDLTELLMKV